MELEEKIEEIIHDHKPGKKAPRFFFIVIGISVGVLLTAGAVAAHHIDTSYKNRVFPGIHIGDINIGGMPREELEKFLTDMNDKLSNEGLHFTITGQEEKKFTLFPVNATENSTEELMHIDVDKEAAYIVNLGKKGTFFSRLFTYARSSWGEPHLKLRFITVDEKALTASLTQETQALVQEPKNADIVVDSRRPVQIQTLPSASGLTFDFTPVKEKLVASWSVLKVPDVALAATTKEPIIKESEVPLLTKNIDAVFAGGPLFLQYTNDNGETQKWKLSEDNIQKWLGLHPYTDGTAGLGLKPEPVKKYIDDYIASEVDIEPENARFAIDENGNVEEFAGSRTGMKVDIEKTYEVLDMTIRSRALQVADTTSTIQLTVAVAEPQIKTGDVNNLGIKDALGVGVSNFKGSPANRVHNIKAAVKKLNGILIKPGEEFSAIIYTQPYTIEAGYLPEKVIKGDKIIPEIGGGLCQVGTTLFRMAMNSGMEITERRNHSLVVNYYNDPSNGLPGTDATIYDPAPDFKFKNDTENYILIQTSVNTEKGDLRFTLWGTKDGRKAYYTKPVVSRWIPSGAARIIQSSSLKPGVKECQNAFRGADASFTYVREMPDGTKQNRIFESHYRPLPQICLVGAEKTTEGTCAEGETCTAPPAESPASPAEATPAPVTPAPEAVPAVSGL